MSDTLRRLSIALEGRYVIEGQAGSGGMATVFQARDVKHDRTVAIKVLRPELAESLGPERFLREIKISAGLSHPHILPLYDSGEAEGSLFYVMPFVEGESLQDRLNREKQLPLDEALQIAREVADALSYAHSHGVIHRDIKPANILLESGHAIVADFGIAKAITDAGGGKLTETGLAIGTPAYMSPEQSAGEKNLDGRSDLYSLGCVLYEMLAGQPPFTGPSVESIVRQHLTADVPPITVVRPSVPQEVAVALESVLSKTPADRLSPASRLVDALRTESRVTPDAPGSAGVGGADGSRLRRVAVIGIAAVALLAGTYTLTRIAGGSPDTLLATGAISEREQVLLADFDNRTSDSTYGTTVTELMRVGLSQSTAISVIDQTQVNRILQLMQRNPADGVPREIAMEAAEREGIGAVVTGEISEVGTGYALAARLISGATGEVLAAEQESASGGDDLVGAIDRLSSHLRERTGESIKNIKRNKPLDQVTTGSMKALRLYSQGLQAWSQADIPRAVRLLEEAITKDSAFAMAYRKLAIILSNSFERRSRQIEAATRAYQYRDRLTDRERYTVTAAYHSLVTGNRDQTIAAYRNVLDMYPDDGLALNNMGVIYSQLRDWKKAAEYYTRLLAVDSTQRLGYSNLASTLGRLSKWDEAAEIIGRFERRFPNNPEVQISKIINSALQKAYDETLTMGDSLLVAEKGTVFWEATAYEWMATLSAMRGQMQDARRKWREALDITASRNLGGQYLFRAARRSIIETMIEGDARAGRQVLENALSRYPLKTLGPLDRPYPWLALAYATAEERDSARALLAEYAQDPDADHSEATEVWKYGVRGVVALGEARYDQAIEDLWRFDKGTACQTCSYAWLARAYDQAGRTDSAMTLMEEFVNLPSDMIWYDAAHLANGYQRLGEHYERIGDAKKAVKYYNRFVELWKNADPKFQPLVQQAKEAIKRLAAERPGTNGK